MTDIENTLSAGQKAEVLRCAGSFTHFCENYLTFYNPKLGRVKANLHDFQKRYVEALETERFLAVPKFRHGGFTTVTAFNKLWKAIFKFDKTILWVCKTASEAVNTCNLVKSQYDHIPEWLVGKLSESNYHQLNFENTGSQFFFCNAEVGKAMCVDDLVIDEAAHIPGMCDYWNAIWPAVSAGDSVAVLSTPTRLKKGEKNWFKDLLENTETNSFRIFQAKWLENPDFNNEDWANRTKANLGDIGWRVEVEGEFVEDEEDDPRHKPNVNLAPAEVRITHREITNPKLPEPKPDFLFCQKIPFWEHEPLNMNAKVETIDLNKTQMDQETRRNIIESSRKVHTEVEHPTFFEHPTVLRNIDEIWEDICEVMPDVMEPQKPPVHDFDYTFESGVSVDLLRMAGVIDEDGTIILDIDYKSEVLRKIKKGFPTQLKLGLDGPAVTVNGIPTKINAKAVEMAILGLAELSSTERAIDTVSRLVRRKLQRLF